MSVKASQPPVEAHPDQRERGKADDPSLSQLAVDTHCHLFLMEEEPRAVIDRARGAGVGSLVCVGIDLASSRRSVEIAQAFRGVFATAGVHPHTASAFDMATGSAIEQVLGDPLVVGVGETGLDYYRRLSPPEDQQRSLRTHVALSRETGKPVVVHIREAWDDAMRILQEERAEGVVLHCFTGDEDQAAEASARGYFVSFAGNATYPKAAGIRRAAAAAAPGQILVETDSPFLPPQTLRGRENSPANLPAVVEVVAAARGLQVEEMVRVTASNARRAFPQVR